MENTRTYIWEITQDILDNFFPQIDRLSELISPDPLRATRIIINKIRRTIDKFENYCPLTVTSRHVTNQEGYYTFKDNYKEIVEGNESMDNLELIPRTIARVGGNSVATFTNMSSTANYWHYAAPTLKCYTRNSPVTVRGIYHYPIYISYTDDGFLTNNSHIFGLDIKQRNMLFNIMELEFLRMIKGNVDRIKMGMSIDFFNLDNDISTLERSVEEDQSACSAGLIGWN